MPRLIVHLVAFVLLSWLPTASGGDASQCFKVVYPPMEAPVYELQPFEASGIGILLMINCPELEQAWELRVETGSKTEMAPLDDWGVEMYELEFSSPPKIRARQMLQLSLRRKGSEVFTEFANISMQCSLLFDPVLKIPFPPEDREFVFYKGVYAFFQSFVDELEPNGPIPHYSVKLTAYGSDMTFQYTFPNVKLAYFGSSLPDGRYDLTFTLLDGLGNSYPPDVTRRIGVNTTMGYPSFRVGPAPTSCPTLRNVTPPCDTTADCNGFPCTTSGCMCREDWFGLHCDHDLHEVLEYLPADDPGLSPWTCAQAAAFREGAKELEKRMWDLQDPPRRKSEICAHLQVFRANSVGDMGTSLWSVAAALGRSMGAGRPLRVAAGWKHVKHKDCKEGEFDCYFEDFTTCVATQETPHLTWEEDGVLESVIGSLSPQRMTQGEGRADILSLSSIPSEYQANGTLWFMSHAMRYVMRPGRRLDLLIREAKRAAGFRGGAVIGMHVHEGCVRVKDLLEYVSAAQVMHARYGVDRVFVVADSPGVLSRLRSMNASFQWTTFSNQPVADNPRLVTETALLGMLLMSESDFLIGRFSTSFLRTVFLLSLADKGFVAPFIGLDGPYRWS